MITRNNQNFFTTLKLKNPKNLFLKLLVIFVPTFLIAYYVDKMVFVLPTLAIGLLLGTGIDNSENNSKDDEEGESGDS